MGSVVDFRRKRLTSFLPADAMQDKTKPYDPRAPLKIDRKAFLDIVREGHPPAMTPRRIARDVHLSTVIDAQRGARDAA